MQNNAKKKSYKSGRKPTLSQQANRALRALLDSLTKQISGRTYVTMDILLEIARLNYEFEKLNAVTDESVKHIWNEVASLQRVLDDIVRRW